jgi:hypothetical protein
VTAAPARKPPRNPWRLPPELAAQVASLASDMAAYASEATDRYDRKSARWRESDDGTSVAGWLDEVGGLAEQLEAIPAEAERAEP